MDSKEETKNKKQNLDKDMDIFKKNFRKKTISAQFGKPITKEFNSVDIKNLVNEINA